MNTRSIQTRSLVIAGLLAATFAPGTARAEGEDWPQFRGIHRDGVSGEAGLLANWPENGPTEAWRVPIGEGYSGISIVGDRLYTMYSSEKEEGAEAGVDYAAAFDANTGKELWRTVIGDKIETEFGNGPRSTPTVDGKTVYVLGSNGDFAALKTSNGDVRWKMSMHEEFGTELPHWGFSTSPLIDGDLLLLQAGGPEGKSHAGIDKKTGKVKWTVGEGNGYNSPVAVTMNGKRRYVYVSGGKLMCIDDAGNEVWSHDWPRGETHSTPLFFPPDKIYASGAEGVGAQLVKITEEGGKATVEEVWKVRVMRNHFNQAVINGGHVFGFDNATLKCMAMGDAKLAWRKRGFGKGSLIYADDHLYVLSDKGKLLLVEASADEYVEKGQIQALKGKCWTAPTLAGGRLYLRNHTEMVAYDVQG